MDVRSVGEKGWGGDAGWNLCIGQCAVRQESGEGRYEIWKERKNSERVLELVFKLIDLSDSDVILSTPLLA